MEVKGDVKNQRYIPLKFLKNKKIKYSLYLYFQINSSKHKDEKVRYFYNNSLAELSRNTKISLNALKKAIKELKSEGMICEFYNNNGEGYFMPLLEGERYILLKFEDEEVRRLVNGKFENELKVYIFLKQKQKHNMKNFKKRVSDGIMITQSIICEEIGMSKSNNKDILKYITNLKDLNIIDYELKDIGRGMKQYCYFLKK